MLGLAHGHDGVGGLDAEGISFGGAKGADGGAVLVDDQARAVLQGFGIHNGRNGQGVSALVGLLDLIGERADLGGVLEGLDVKKHGAAADEAIARGDVFVEVVVLEDGAGALAQGFLGGKPDVAFDAASAEGADGGAVSAHEECRTRLLGCRALGVDHGR